MPISNKNKLQSIQIVRAISVCIIVFYHCVSGFSRFVSEWDVYQWWEEDYWNTSYELYFLPRLSQLANLGMDAFFVVSGFIMSAVIVQGTKQNRTRIDYFSFLYDRLTRITPVYWSLTLLYAIVLLLIPELAPNMPFDLDYIVCSLLFIPSFSPAGQDFPLIFSAWTLSYEIVFYLVLAICFGSFPKYGFLTASLMLVSLHTISYTNMAESVAVRRCTEIVLLDFVLGIGIYQLWVRSLLSPRITLPLLACSVSLVLNAPSHVDMSIDRFVFWSLPAAGLTLFLLSIEGRFQNGLVTRLFEYLGTASFSIYLVHDFTIKIFYTAATRFQWFEVTSPVVILGAVFVFSIIVSLLVYEFFERPVYQWTKSVKPQMMNLLSTKQRNT